MDSETKMLLLALAALAGGVALGWCIKQDLRKRAGARGGLASKAAPSPGAGGDGTFMIPVGGGSATPCGCRS